MKHSTSSSTIFSTVLGIYARFIVKYGRNFWNVVTLKTRLEQKEETQAEEFVCCLYVNLKA